MSYLLSIDYMWIYLVGILLFGYSQWILANARGRLIHANEPVPESKSGSSTAVLLVAFMIMGGTGNTFMLLGLLASFNLVSAAAFLLVANLLWQLMVSVIHFVYLLMNAGQVD